MNFHQLKAFYYTVKCGSLSAAAEALYITQPAVTKQIQQLHSAYGVKLLNRFGKKMVLTDAGEALYDFASRIFEAEAQAEEELIHLSFIQVEFEFLLFDIDGSHHVFVLELRCNSEHFAEDVEP